MGPFNLDAPATGPERHGWRVHVETPHGVEAIGVLIAPSGELWRSRILTYPNVLWTAPGGRSTIKFVANTPQEAERAAIEYIGAHARRMGWHRRDGLEAVEVAPVPVSPPRRPAPRGTRPSRARQQSPRKMKCLPVRFGVARPSTLAQTVNLSSEGMCVATPSPLEAGEAVRMHFDVHGHTVTLHGFVVWQRARHEFGRPVGMGLRLTEPPEIYTNFVASLP
jgi:hypothetical protein